MSPTATVLVVAKAPVPGLAKTRLAAAVGAQAAAEIAAAALLDTLDAVAALAGQRRVVAMTGDLSRACRSDEIRRRLLDFTVITQRGEDFAERLVHAHGDAAPPGAPIVQIGMDTPQVGPDLLAECITALQVCDAVLGMAEDGGWWALGVRDAKMARCLRDVPMSQPDTGALTLAALRGDGLDVALATELSDVDTIADIDRVRAMCPPGGRFAEATRMVGV